MFLDKVVTVELGTSTGLRFERGGVVATLVVPEGDSWMYVQDHELIEQLMHEASLEGGLTPDGYTIYPEVIQDCTYYEGNADQDLFSYDTLETWYYEEQYRSWYWPEMLSRPYCKTSPKNEGYAILEEDDFPF